MEKKQKQVYQLKITLIDTKPPIWRRIIVESNVKLPDLHKIIQTTMGWSNSHLHEFSINGLNYSPPDEENEMEYIDYRKVKLDKLFDTVGDKFNYIYDFGDDWNHKIVIEDILPLEKGKKYPLCIAGKRRCSS